jgi:DNA-binding transcriptional LysR family regulator
VVDKGSLAKAASMLHQTQPAISLQIKRLEEHANQSLFEKVGQQLQPTQASIKLTAFSGSGYRKISLKSSFRTHSHDFQVSTLAFT